MRRFGHDGASGLLFALLSAASFSLSGSFASGLLNTGWTPGAVVLCRVAIGALCLAPFVVVALRGRWFLLRRNARLIVIYGAVPMALTQFAFFSAVSHMDVGPALLIEFTAPAVVVLWLWLRRGERPTRITVLGGAIVAVGLVLVLDLVAGGADLAPIGAIWALIAMAGCVVYFVLSADTSVGIPPLALAGCGLVVGTVALGLLGGIGALPLRATTAAPTYAGTTTAWWLPLLGLGVVTAGVAYCAGIAATRRLGSRVASFVALLEVVGGVVAAWILLDQVPGVVQVAGSALVLGGIVLVKLGERPLDRVHVNGEVDVSEGLLARG